ncbi:MAG: acyltransferase family protein [Pseudorhodoferax sp.]
MTKNQRVEWVDIAKAFAIILVAIYHSAVIGIPLNLASPVWTKINWALEAFRMPVFFFASGLFAESLIKRPWKNLWSSRLALLAWTFVLWTILRFLYFYAVPLETRPHETHLPSLLLTPIWPTSGLWFLHALAIFFVLSKLLARVPLWIKLTTAAILSALFFSFLSTGNLSYNGMARYYVFFLCGAYFRDVALRLNQPPQWGLTAIAFGVLGISMAAIYTFGLGNAFGSKTVLSLIAIAAGCLLARVVAETPAAQWMAYIGKNTLPIYVQHVILIAAFAAIADAFLPDDVGGIAHVFPILATSIVVPLALLTGAAAAKGKWSRFLFEAPSWLARSDTSRARPPAIAKL